MARFSIYSKDGKGIRYSGCPKYNGTYLKVSFLDFGNVSVPESIPWQVGDYVDYPRAGRRYRLYSLPTVKKQARAGESGESFLYQGVQLHAKTHDLEVAPFRDYVKNDNGIHFSTRSAVSTYENVYGITERIQKNLDDLYPGEWTVRVYGNLDEDFVKKITESQNFSVDGNCLAACDKLYEIWGIGWLHVVEDGKDVLLFGKPNRRESDNTSDVFVYGKGNGLTAIQKSASNPDDMATRLYVYGSTRNMVSRHYNGLGIKDAESVDIQHLMIPVEYWGKTDGLPDARKAYIEDSASVAKLGLIPKSVYFEGGDYPEIYPTISGVTIKDVRDVMSPEDKYYPNPDIYDGTERIDRVKDVVNPKDDGAETFPGYIEIKSPAVERELIESSNFYYYLAKNIPLPPSFSGVLDFKSRQQGYVEGLDGFNTIRVHDIKIYVRVTDGENGKVYGRDVVVPYKKRVVDGDTDLRFYDFDLSGLDLSCEIPSGINKPLFSASLKVHGMVSLDIKHAFFHIDSQTYIAVVKKEQEADFIVYVRQLGFDINKMVALTSEGKCTVAMNTGMCSGRQFPVVSAKYREETDDWELGLNRQVDESLGEKFPNSNYPIAIDDEFVLLDIAMPKIYISLAEQRLYKTGMELYEEISRISPYYEPSIDPIVMARSSLLLSEGMYMHIHDEDVVDNEGGSDYVLIDTLTISEGEAAIPTYKVTLREKKRKSFQQTTSEAISDLKDKTSGIDVSGKINTEYANRAGSADFASNAEKWAGYRFSDLMDQSVRTGDAVAFSEVTTEKVTADEVVSANYTPGTLGAGHRLWRGNTGSTLEVDNIVARKTLTVFEMLIQQLRHQGGVVLYTAASIECTKVEGTENGYKCYFDTKDGSLPNLFVAGDQARCQRFDSGNTEYKYYWRYVSEVGDDYISLSKSDCDEGSGIPEEGDNIIQLGNRTDPTRMAAKMTVMVGDNTPRDEYYEGIDGYDLSGKLVTVVGVKEGKVGVFTEHGVFKGNVTIGSGSSGLANLSEWKDVEKILNGINDDTILEPFEKASIRTEWIAINGIESTTEGSTSGSYYGAMQAVRDGGLTGVSLVYGGTEVSYGGVSHVYSLPLADVLTSAYTALRSYLDTIGLNDRENRYEGFDRARLSELLKTYYDAESLVRDRNISDLEYIEKLFPKGNMIAEGAVLGGFIGVTNDNNAVVAGLDGLGHWKNDTYGKIVFFLGAEGIDNNTIENPNTIFFEDGTVATNKLLALSGRVGNFNIRNGWIVSGEKKDNKNGTKISIQDDNIYIRDLSDDPSDSHDNIIYISNYSGIILDPDFSQYATLGEGIAVKKKASGTKRYRETWGFQASLNCSNSRINKGFAADVYGGEENYAFYAYRGQFAGLRPKVRTVDGSTELTTLDHTILIDIELGSYAVLALPDNPEPGQEYLILTNGVKGQAGQHKISSKKANINYPYYNSWSATEIDIGKSSVTYIVFAPDRSGNGYWWINDI